MSDDPLFIVNLGVWSSIDALYDFTYRSDHKTVFKRRHEWFEAGRTEHRAGGSSPAPYRPPRSARAIGSPDAGPSTEAFTFKEHFPPPNAGDEDVPEGERPSVA